MAGKDNDGSEFPLRKYDFAAVFKEASCDARRTSATNKSHEIVQIGDFVRDVKAELRIRSGHTYVAEDADNGFGSDPQAAEFLYNVLTLLSSRCEELTCIIEPAHVDDVYRDLYQSAYSREFFDVDRSCIRLSFFNKAFDVVEYHSLPGRLESWEPDYDGEAGKALQEVFIGSMVLLPVKGGVVGRTLLDPRWLLEDDAPCVMRLSDYNLTILGKRLTVSTFPFRKQDDVVLTCAELSILNLLCYYSNEFPEYPYTMPCELLDEISNHTSERVMPSRGQPYPVLGRLLRRFSFEPRRYKSTMIEVEANHFAPEAPHGSMRRLTQCYLESGIPVCVGVMPEKGQGHSLICIGMDEQPQLEDKEVECVFDGDSTIFLGHCGEGADSRSSVLLASAEALGTSRRFVTIDDSELPFHRASYDNISFPAMRVEEILVPLTRSMALDALKARETAVTILSSKKMGIVGNCGLEGRDGQSRFVYTLRLASVRSLLRWRASHEDPTFGLNYVSLPLPSMTWLVEVFSLESWRDGAKRAMGELVLDATTNSENPFSLLVLARWPRRFYYRDPHGEVIDYEYESVYDDCGEVRTFEAYDRNLRHIRRAWQ